MTAIASRAEWAQRVAAWRASGKSAEEFARGQPYKASTLCTWEKTLRQRPPLKHDVPATSASRASTGPSPVVPMAQVTAVHRDPLACIVVEVCGSRIVVRRGFDAELLWQVASALRGTR